MLTPGQYAHHPKCPHLIATLQRVVDDVALPMWMPGQCSGTTPILVRGPGGPRSAAAAAPAPRVEVYTTLYGAVAQVVVPPTVYETVQALGYHHLGDLYTENHQVLQNASPEETSASPQGDPGATCVAGPPRCGTGPAPKGTHAAMASGTQGLPAAGPPPRRSSTAHRPQAVWQCIAGVAVPAASS